MFSFGNIDLKLSGERFNVIYKIQGNGEEAYKKAQDICLEQTVEFPGELVPDGLKKCIIGRIEDFNECGDSFIVNISYPVETAAGELTQLINVIFGNISIKSGIKAEAVKLPDSLLRCFRGPRFGRMGLREILGVEKRPVIFTALKPMGLSPRQLAELAYRFALGGIDIIKDDHGLSNQCFSPFEERVKLCTKAVERANRETGGKSIYVPNITAAYGQIEARARLAKKLGAGGVLISPGITGLDAMRSIAENDDIALPVFSHPAFQGSYVLTQNGLSHHLIFGQLARLAGADAAIYPNFGGRFSFSREECKSIVEGTCVDMGHIKPIFPCPAGGMSLESIPESLKVYGNDVIFLVGGGLFRQGPDITANSRYFRSMLD